MVSRTAHPLRALRIGRGTQRGTHDFLAERQPELPITKQGDRELRSLLVQGAHYILGHFGPDTDLRRWGLKLAARGGKNAKKRAIVAVARKLSVLLHRLWVSGRPYIELLETPAKAA